jgi:aspartyl-tRNA(Asn)/glutamyl-tRNA(Gln) amidotransferase subunit B
VIIEQVLAANPENAEKVKSEPKLIQWFVGQTMKAAKGKAPAPVVLEKLKARFGG